MKAENSFIKDSTLSRWETRQAQRWQLPEAMGGGSFLLCEEGEGPCIMDRVVCNGGCFQSPGDASYRLGVGVFDPKTKFIQEPLGQPSS